MADRFFRFVEPELNSGCWLWSGATTFGYGRFNIGNRKSTLAHRVAWKLAGREIPQGLCLCHRCDVRTCVNPDHLFLGTQADNMADRQAKGRTPRGTAHGQAKLNPEKVREIRRTRALGATIVALAEGHGVARRSVQDILSGRNWGHVH